MIDIKLVFDLMRDVEKIHKNDKDVDKKAIVMKNIRKVIGDTEFYQYSNEIDDIIEFIIFLSVNSEILKNINRKALRFCCPVSKK